MVCAREALTSTSGLMPCNNIVNVKRTVVMNISHFLFYGGDTRLTDTDFKARAVEDRA